MINFKDFVSGLNQSQIENPSVQVTSKVSAHTLFLKFDNRDVLIKASYSGAVDPWLGSMCSIVSGKTLSQMTALAWKDWDETFKQDQTFWDFKAEKAENFFFTPLELLKAGLDSYRGREYLYKDTEALICRCYGVRENDVLDYIRTTDDPTPEGLATVSKAGMGCRSCVPQLTKWLSIHMPKTQTHHYKEKTRAHWLLEIDYMLNCFPESADWKMEVKSFQGSQVSITFDKDVSQPEEEEVGVRLQDFLAAALDSDLSFFLIRKRQRSNA
ncbi:MAG: (2Fe-2S)-binding protein [Bdellovibrionales bacterium]|nr:(2Fe-2S)-binding protein [Bdellovibrionales bacterium]